MPTSATARTTPEPSLIFEDGFETGDLSHWSDSRSGPITASSGHAVGNPVEITRK
jgi:hypothetical protein